MVFDQKYYANLWIDTKEIRIFNIGKEFFEYARLRQYENFFEVENLEESLTALIENEGYVIIYNETDLFKGGE